MHEWSERVDIRGGFGDGVNLLVGFCCGFFYNLPEKM